MAQLTERQLQLLIEPNLAHVATLSKDGSPQSTPVWGDYKGGYVLFNTIEGRQKSRNLTPGSAHRPQRRRPQPLRQLRRDPGQRRGDHP